MPTHKASTTARGLGWAHQQVVARLLRKHTNGTLCWWCALPMFRDKHANWDHHTLAGDHSVPRVHGGPVADRLLHGICNSQRGDGRWDAIRPAAKGVHPQGWKANEAAITHTVDSVSLAMDW